MTHDTSPHCSRPVRNAHVVPTSVGASREGFRPKLLPKQPATGELLTSGETCEKFRLGQRLLRESMSDHDDSPHKPIRDEYRAVGQARPIGMPIFVVEDNFLAAGH